MKFLDSAAPFDPINPYGSKAKARMPEGWKNPFLEPLFRVHVDTPNGESVPVSPGMMRGFCDEFASVIQQTIRTGQLKDWTNPHVRPV